jgi:superfamily II DNA or RNA helicase
MKIKLYQRDAHWCKVIDPIAIGIIHELLTYTEMVRPKWKEYPEVIEKSLFDGRGNKFLYGLVPYVTKKLRELGHSVEINSIDYEKIPHTLFPKLPGIKFEPYQSKAIRKAVLKGRGLIQGSTGSGKSVIIGGVIAAYNKPITLVITPSKSIFGQLVADFKKWFPDCTIGQIGDNQCELGEITVALYQSLRKWDLKKYNSFLQLICIDEAHQVNKSIDTIMNQFTKVHNRYGFTATPQKEEKDFKKALKMEGIFGPIVYEITDEACNVRVVEVDVCMVKFLNARPVGNKWSESYRCDVLYSLKRNQLLLKAAKRLALDKNKTCLILLDEIEQGEIMMGIAKKMGLKPLFANGNQTKEHNDKCKRLLNKRIAKLVIATKVFGIGTNIPNVDCVVLASARKSEIDTLQKIGRGRRRTENKDKLILIDSIDLVKGNKKFHKYFYEYSLERMNIYRAKKWHIKRIII